MIKDLGEFEKLLKICRKQGIKSIQVGDVSVNFGDAPQKQKGNLQADDDIPTDGLSLEEAAFYHVEHGS